MPDDDAFYDEEGVLERYLRHRDRPDNPNDAIERPIFLELAGDLGGLDIVDLGCGDARFGREALDRGARSYLGIEAAESMAALARRNLEGRNGRVVREPIEGWRPDREMADLVTSRLALSYLEDLTGVFGQIATALRPAGRLIVSVEHPVVTSSFASLVEGARTSWRVDDYFRSGARPHRWLGREIVKYHRTLDDYFALLQGSGLRLERLRESRPSRENFVSEEEYERRLRIPLFLFLVARRPHVPVDASGGPVPARP